MFMFPRHKKMAGVRKLNLVAWEYPKYFFCGLIICMPIFFFFFLIKGEMLKITSIGLSVRACLVRVFIFCFDFVTFFSIQLRTLILI